MEKGKLKPWDEYVSDIRSGKILACTLIKQAVERFERFRARDDIYFDEKAVEECYDFFKTLKHFLGKSAGRPFILENWQAFILANIFGLKYKKTGYRVCTETMVCVARKAGKDAFMAGMCLYLLIIDGEASPEIVCAANSTDQSRILFNYITQFSKSIDPKENIIEHYRNYVHTEFNNGIVKVISSDSTKADGMNLSCFCLDEFHEARDRKMYDVLKSSQGMREQPLAIIITTAGFNLSGPCHDMYELAVQVLGGVEGKDMDNFFPFIWQLDPDDDWTDPANFIKCQPNLGVTVTEEFMLAEVNKAKVDPTAEVGVKTKTLNMWCTSEFVWIKPETIVGCMKEMKIEDFEGYPCVIGVDLSSVGDMAAMDVMIPIENKRYFFHWSFLPEDTYVNHPNRALYEKFHKLGELDLTPGNIIDYDYITALIGRINSICPVTAVYYDRWNSSQWSITMTELGYNIVPFAQNIGNYSQATKEFQRLILAGDAVLQKSQNFLWQMMCTTIKEDSQGNIKPVKQSYSKQKIDNVIAATTALGGYLAEHGIATDFEIFSLPD